MNQTSPAGGTPAGVIHDLGYRGYHGAMRGDRAVAGSLFLHGLGHVYGFGRTGRAKFRPWALLAAYLVPSLATLGILSVGGLTELPVALPAYATNFQILAVVFAAVQAPVLFGRDLRYRSIVLYLARPLSPRWFATVRYLSMSAALWLFLMCPVLVLYLGALLTGLDPATMARQFWVAVLSSLVLAACLAAITGVISSWATRSGLAVVASVGVLLVGGTLVTVVNQLMKVPGTLSGQLAGLLSPFSMSDGVAYLLDRTLSITSPPEGMTGMLFVLVAVLGPVLGVLLLQSRFSKAVAQ